MKNFRKAQFITFEGGEGSGKTTQSKMLHEYLLSKGIKAIRTREIGGTEEAEKIRDLLVYSELLPMTELLLVMAARYEHINKVIIPALNRGEWVICDRFIDSTACYQSEESGLTLGRVYELHAELMTVNNAKAIMPDLTCFMDVAPEIGLERGRVRGDNNKFEEKNIEFHQKIYKCFKTIANNYPDRIITIDNADKTIEQIHQEVVNKVFYK